MRQLILILILIIFSCEAFAQNVGIGTASPKARLHVADSSVLFSAPSTLPSTGLPPATGTGNRMMWYAPKAAIRAGGATGTDWDESVIGKYSAAFGLGNRASGEYAASVGWGNSSSGSGSFTAGINNSASGNYATALGANTNAQAYGSLVLGRYNLIAGTTDQWVNNDPLLVVGNGYTQVLPTGEAQVVRSNALTINKAGVASFHNNLKVFGTSTFDEQAHMKGGVIVDGTGNFRNNLNVTGKLGVDSIENLKLMNADYSNGTMPEVNLVPLGVVRFRANFEVTTVNNSPNTTYTNLAGNFVTSVVGLYDEGLGIGNDAMVGIRLNFNGAKVGNYKEIIAVGNSYFNGIGFSGNTTLSATGTFVSKDATDKPVSCTIQFKSSSLPNYGFYSTEGTYMFYGLK